MHCVSDPDQVEELMLLVISRKGYHSIFKDMQHEQMVFFAAFFHLELLPASVKISCKVHEQVDLFLSFAVETCKHVCGTPALISRWDPLGLLARPTNSLLR